MTRRLVYGGTLWLFLATIGMSLAAILIPEWIVWDAYPDKTESFYPKLQAARGPAAPVHYTYGLHERCSTVASTCTPFPRYEECQGGNRKFCSLWRTTGFLMSATIIFELAAIVAFLICILGGLQKRVNGWKIVVLILGFCVVTKVVAMGIITGLKESDDHFFPGWYFGQSYILCTVSWCLQVVIAGVLVASAFLLPPEGGYELIPDRRD